MNYDELRQAAEAALHGIDEQDHVCLTGELLLRLLDENAALRAALIKAAETLQWVADEQPKVIAFDFSEIRKALGYAS